MSNLKKRKLAGFESNGMVHILLLYLFEKINKNLFFINFSIHSNNIFFNFRNLFNEFKLLILKF